MFPISNDPSSENRWFWYYGLTLLGLVVIFPFSESLLSAGTIDMIINGLPFLTVVLTIGFSLLFFILRWLIANIPVLHRKERSAGSWFLQSIGRGLLVVVLMAVSVYLLNRVFFIDSSVDVLNPVFFKYAFWMFAASLLIDFFILTQLVVALDCFAQSLFTLCGYSSRVRKSALDWIRFLALCFGTSALTIGCFLYVIDAFLDFEIHSSSSFSSFFSSSSFADGSILIVFLFFFALAAGSFIYGFCRFLIALFADLFCSSDHRNPALPRQSTFLKTCRRRLNQ